MNATVISASISELPKALQFGKQIGTQRNSGTKFTQQQLFALESAFHEEAAQARVNEQLGLSVVRAACGHVNMLLWSM